MTTSIKYDLISTPSHPDGKRHVTIEFVNYFTKPEMKMTKTVLKQLIESETIDRTIFDFANNKLFLSLGAQRVISNHDTLWTLFDTPGIKYLTLNSCAFTDECWKQFCNILSLHPLISVRIVNCRLNDRQVQELISALAISSRATLELLDLNENEITAEGVSCIGDFLKNAQLLTYLSLQKNYIDDVAVLALAQGLLGRRVPFKELCLSESKRRITEACMLVFLQHVPALQQLHLNGNAQLESLNILNAIANHPLLRRVSLLGTHFDTLSFNKWLRALKQCVSPQGTAEVTQPTINLWIRDQIAARRETLLQIDLPYIDNAIATYLMQVFENTNIAFTFESRSQPNGYIPINEHTPPAPPIVQAPLLPSLRQLDFKVPPSLRELQAEKLAIEQNLKHFETIITEDSQPFCLADDTLQIEFDQLTTIDNDVIFKALCAYCKRRPSIHTLIFRNCSFQNITLTTLLEVFSVQKRVYHLVFDGCPLEKIHFQRMSQIPWLLSSLVSFSYNTIKFNTIDDIEGIFSFLSKLMHLQELAIEDCNLTSNIVSIILQSIRSFRYLSRLSLKGNQIDDAGAHYLALHLQDHPSIHQLDISKNKVGNLGCVALARAFATYPANISVLLNLNQNAPVTNVGVDALLQRAHSLVVLNVSKNPLIHAAETIQQALNHAKKLNILDLTGTALCDADTNTLVVNKKQRTSSKDIIVKVQVDALSTDKRKALAALKIGARFCFYEEHPNGELWQSLVTAIQPTQYLLTQIKQLPVSTPEELGFKTHCFHTLLAKVFDVVNVAKDGNCLFSCFAIALQGIKSATLELDYASLRMHAVDHILTNRKEFLAFFAEDPSKQQKPEDQLKQHCATMLEAKTWGGDAEIKALYDLLKLHSIPRSIVVFQMDTLNLQENGFLPHLVWGDPRQEEPIFLFYENRNHYILLRPKV